MPISATEFEFFQKLVIKSSGIVLESGKEYLVESRLAAVVRENSLPSIAVLIQKLQASSMDPLHKKVTEAMTTNETSFFRDQHPFDALRKSVIPALLTKRSATRKLNIWCAAASSGQEPYTIAMTMFEAIPMLKDWTISFVSTDLASHMIQRCKAGRYSQLEINRGLPAPLMVKYFRKDGLEWQIDEKLRSQIDFREMNLLNAWPKFAPLDIVFIRNVLIYFDAPTKKEIFRKIRSVLQPDGYLFLGGAETTMNLDDSFARLPMDRSGCYQLKTQLANAA